MRVTARKMQFLLIDPQHAGACAALVLAVQKSYPPHGEVPPVRGMAVYALSDVKRVLTVGTGPSELVVWLKAYRHNSVCPFAQHGLLRYAPLRLVNVFREEGDGAEVIGNIAEGSKLRVIVVPERALSYSALILNGPPMLLGWDFGWFTIPPSEIARPRIVQVRLYIIVREVVPQNHTLASDGCHRPKLESVFAPFDEDLKLLIIVNRYGNRFHRNLGSRSYNHEVRRAWGDLLDLVSARNNPPLNAVLQPWNWSHVCPSPALRG